MQIASRLRDTTLGDLLAQLYRARATGVLELIEPRARHAIHLRRGFVQAVESERAALRLGDIATRLWGVARPAVERARMFAQGRGLRIGHALVATHVIGASQLDALLAEQQRARLEMLYALDDAELRFRVARPLPKGAAEQSPLEAKDTFFGRPRKRPRASGEDEGDRATRQTQPARGAAHRSTTTSASGRSRATVAHRFANEYATLGLDPSADERAVRDAYRALVLALHPDRAQGASDEERQARSRRLAAVVRAYKTLSAS
jgi:DnaJ-domain-containing protein 1